MIDVDKVLPKGSDGKRRLQAYVPDDQAEQVAQAVYDLLREDPLSNKSRVVIEAVLAAARQLKQSA